MKSILIYVIVSILLFFLFQKLQKIEFSKDIENLVNHESIRFNPYSISEKNKEQLSNITKLCNDEFRKKIKEFPDLKFEQILKRNTVLLYGSPGSGKTTFVKYLCKNLKKDLVNINLNDVISPFVDMESTTLNNALKKINTYKEKIIFFDEVDTVINHRVNNVAGYNHKNSSINVMLTWLDSINTENEGNNIIIFATNRLDILDKAFVDRMTYKIPFDYPTKSQMKEYWRLHLPHLSETDVARLNSLNVKSFREAEDLIKNGVINAIKNDRTSLIVEDILEY